MADQEKKTSSVEAQRQATGTPEPATAGIAASPGSAGDLLRVPPAPLLVDAEMLVAGFRQLQARIPGYVHLTTPEARGMGRTAKLDPEFVSAGLHAASAWPDTKRLVGLSGEEMRDLDDEARRWDQVERELRIVLKGISDANLTRKNKLGRAILKLYWRLADGLKGRDIEWLRPYYEEMRKAWQRSRQRNRDQKDQGSKEG